MRCKIGRLEHCEAKGCEWEKEFYFHCRDCDKSYIPDVSPNIAKNLATDEYYRLKVRYNLSKHFTNKKKKLFEISKGVCYLCENKIENIDEANIDHVIPLSKGGRNAMFNLKLTHIKCNSFKSDKLLSELQLPLKL